MGEHIVRKLSSVEDRAQYNRQLINDIAALEEMLRSGRIEKSPIRIGAEQEFCLIDQQWLPASNAMNMLQAIDDDHFTTEIATYNLEANLAPVILKGDCFSRVHEQLETFIKKADRAAKAQNCRILLTGILPSIQHKHLKDEYMAPVERYFALNDTLKSLRGQDFELHIKGANEVHLEHHSVLFEGCNTSFQIHLQIDPDDFVKSYNWAQAIAGPVLSVCTNSPLLLGRELWAETRIALFTQSIDTRASGYHLNEREARVSFGEEWASGNAATIFKENILRFRSILTSTIEHDSLEMLSSGKVPKLKALALHNGTVYRWNRPCYGVTDGKPHLRIECRYIPSGPTTVDEIANMVFWVGVMSGRPSNYDDVAQKMNFKDVKNNFLNAARYGKASQMMWDGQLVPSQELITSTLLPIARKGLEKLKIDVKDINFYLSIIENRANGQDGCRWMQETYRNFRKENKRIDACRLLTRSIYHLQKEGDPISMWKVLGNEEVLEAEEKSVNQCMTRKVITVHENDSAALAAKVMEWRDIHHLPVINDKGKLVGLVSWSDMSSMQETTTVPVGDFMKRDLILVNPEESMTAARSMMNEHQIGCLPVVYHGALVGIITRNDCT